MRSLHASAFEREDISRIGTTLWPLYRVIWLKFAILVLAIGRFSMETVRSDTLADKDCAWRKLRRQLIGVLVSATTDTLDKSKPPW